MRIWRWDKKRQSELGLVGARECALDEGGRIEAEFEVEGVWKVENASMGSGEGMELSPVTKGVLENFSVVEKW